MTTGPLPAPPSRVGALLAPTREGPTAKGPAPTFSVVVAAWQAAGTLGAAVRSALDQTYPPHEVIVADDGSTDDPTAVVAVFGQAVRLLSLPHRGAGSARNAAAEIATGSFLVVMDADDVWHPKRLERLGDLAVQRPDLDLMTTDAWFVVDGQRRGTFYEAGGAFPVNGQTTEILRRNFFFAHVAVRSTAWAACGGFATDLAQGQDWDLWLRLLLSGSVAGCVDEPLADYTIHGASLSADRAGSLMARVTLLDRAVANHDLSAEQRAVVAESRAVFRRRALAARAEQALLAKAPGRRWASVDLALAPGGSARGRVAAAAAAIAPGWAGGHLRRRQDTAGRARTDRAIS